MSTDSFSTATERDALQSYLDQMRQALVRKVDGLSEQDARRASTVSSLSLLAIRRPRGTPAMPTSSARRSTAAADIVRNRSRPVTGSDPARITGNRHASTGTGHTPVGCSSR
jgi:Protein of unknown function (DUF664)